MEIRKVTFGLIWPYKTSRAYLGRHFIKVISGLIWPYKTWYNVSWHLYLAVHLALYGHIKARAGWLKTGLESRLMWLVTRTRSRTRPTWLGHSGRERVRDRLFFRNCDKIICTVNMITYTTYNTIATVHKSVCNMNSEHSEYRLNLRPPRLHWREHGSSTKC